MDSNFIPAEIVKARESIAKFREDMVDSGPGQIHTHGVRFTKSVPGLRLALRDHFNGYKEFPDTVDAIAQTIVIAVMLRPDKDQVSTDLQKTIGDLLDLMEKEIERVLNVAYSFGMTVKI